MKKFYKGDIVIDDKEAFFRWGLLAYAVVDTIEVEGYTLFYRSFKNWIKFIYDKLK